MDSTQQKNPSNSSSFRPNNLAKMLPAVKKPPNKYQPDPDSDEDELEQICLLTKRDVTTGRLSSKKSARMDEEAPRPCSQKTSRMSKDLKITTEDYKGEVQDKVENHYVLFDPPLGSGLFGTVHRAKHKKTGVERAIKKIKKSAVEQGNSIEMLLSDFHILKKLSHPNIIEVYEYYIDDDHIAIVSQYCSGGELFDLIIQQNKFTEATAAGYFVQILSAIVYCHERSLVHCDLKPENIVIAEKGGSQLKVIDFGNAAFINNNKLTSKFGTVYYIAPEVLLGSYDEKCDVWSLGVILYILLSGRPPFNGNSDREILTNVRQGQVKFPPERWKNTSEQAIDLITQMLNKDPEKRISSKAAMAHPWVQEQTHPTSAMDMPLTKESIRALKDFNAGTKLQEAILYYITINLSSNEEMNDLTQKFMSLDQDRDGQISVRDLRKTLVDLGKDPLVCDAIVAKILGSLEETEEDRVQISFDKFLVVMGTRAKFMNEERLKAAFGMFDADKDDRVSIKEFMSILNRGVFSSLSEDIWLAMFAESGIADTEYISLNDFTTLMGNLTKNQSITQSLSQT